MYNTLPDVIEGYNHFPGTVISSFQICISCAPQGLHKARHFRHAAGETCGIRSADQPQPWKRLGNPTLHHRYLHEAKGGKIPYTEGSYEGSHKRITRRNSKTCWISQSFYSSIISFLPKKTSLDLTLWGFEDPGFNVMCLCKEIADMK